VVSIFRSSRTQAKIVFGIVTGLAIAVSLVGLYLAPGLGTFAVEIAIVPLFLTMWVGAAWYRQRFGGRQWQRRVAVAMASSGALGAVEALAAMMPWTEWPSAGSVLRWTTWVVIGSAAYGVVCVPLMWLADRRLLRIRVKRRHRTSAGAAVPPVSPASSSRSASGSHSERSPR
jgi:multisubunit Na+/H+ antiporter MnhB subunit